MKTQLRVLSAILTLLLNEAMLPKNPSVIFYHLKQNFKSGINSFIHIQFLSIENDISHFY